MASVEGGSPTATGDDTVTVSMSVPLPPLPTTPPRHGIHPDATNWNAPEPEVGDPAYEDDPVMSVLATPHHPWRVANRHSPQDKTTLRLPCTRWLRAWTSPSPPR